MEYRHTQFGYYAPIVLVIFAVLMVIIGTLADDSAGTLIAVGLLFLVLGAAMVNFNRLTTVVDDAAVDVRFGWGWPRRIIPLDEIRSARQVRNRWYHGWGIRLVRNGWMFNVWGYDAIELELASGRVFRIGTDEPTELGQALTERIPTS